MGHLDAALGVNLEELACGDFELATCLATWFGSRKRTTGNVNKYALKRWANFLKARKKTMLQADKIDALEFMEIERARPGIKSRGRTDLKLCNASVYRTIAILSGFHRHMRELGKATGNPFEYALSTLNTPKPNERREFRALDNSEVRLILALRPRSPVGLRSRALMALLFGGGLRLSEALNLRVCDIHTTSKGTLYLQLRDTKAGDSPCHALPDWCKEPLWQIISQRNTDGARPDGYLLTTYSADSSEALETKLSPDRARFLFKRDCAALGIENVSPHCARHTAITQLAEKGISVWKIQEFARHASIRTTERYLHRRGALDEAPGKCLDYAVDS